MNILKLCIGVINARIAPLHAALHGAAHRALPSTGVGVTALCLLLLLAAGCGKKENTAGSGNQGEQSAPTQNAAAASSPAASSQTPAGPLSGWIKFSPKDGGFTVLLPNAPAETQTNMHTGSGELRMHTYVSARGETDAYSVTYYDFPAAMSSDPKLFLARVEALMVVSQHGKVTYYSPKPYGNDPGTEFEFAAGGKANFSMRTRLILVGNRVYAPAVLFHTGAPLPAESKPFFDSFSLQ
ncbi:MAG TPA: hypothetical protein VMF08_01795 [Candidatus Sulfotelmatobacter sp.]|nr:hypothetical protein [Candidatus Sulfotelmatobacter sp.]